LPVLSAGELALAMMESFRVVAVGVFIA